METCMYCLKDERLDRLMFPVAEFESTRLYLYRESTYPGRCVLVPDRHVCHLTDLTDQERNRFFADAVKTAKALEKVFAPDQINYLMFGDSLPHLHLHLVPKYREGADFGSLFRMMPEDGRMMSTAECREQAELIRKALSENQPA